MNAFDNPQRLVIAYTMALPFGKGKRWLAGAASFIKNHRFFRDGRLNLRLRRDSRTGFWDAQFGVVTSQANSPRRIQFALKLLF